jgi:hypothetical protein
MKKTIWLLGLLASVAACTTVDDAQIEGGLRPSGALVPSPHRPVFASLVAGGNFFYSAGTGTATVSVPSGQFVKQITAHAASGASGSFTIGGGDTVNIPGGVGFSEQFDGSRATLAGPAAIVFTSVDSYYVSWSN